MASFVFDEYDRNTTQSRSGGLIIFKQILQISE